MSVPWAAANNAAWCDLVCRTAGLPTGRRRGFWSTTTRSPDAYPDAVTLRPGVRADDVVAAIDATPGASVKDSFADLDLAPSGFSVLFEAHWVLRAVTPVAPVPHPSLAWRPVDAGSLPRWLAAHGSVAIRPGVLDDPDVRLLLADDADGPVAVAALNRSTTGDATVVGISNVQALRADPDVVWQDLVALAHRELGPHPLVGYESGSDLGPPLHAGFSVAGPLRVWLRRDARSVERGDRPREQADPRDGEHERQPLGDPRR